MLSAEVAMDVCALCEEQEEKPDLETFCRGTGHDHYRGEALNKEKVVEASRAWRDGLVQCDAAAKMPTAAGALCLGA